MPEAFNLNEKVLELEDLPTLQPVASSLMKLLSDKTTDAQHIEELIQTDPALTAKILKVVNSAYYGMRNIVDTVKLAVVILGFDELRKMISSVALMNLSNELLDNNEFDFKSFWKHSVTVAFFSEKIYKDFKIESHGEEFTAGLMHDVGKLVAGMIIPDYTIKVIDAVVNHKFSIYEAEYLLYGTSHMEIGGFLAEKWNFPKSIVNCIFSHHGDSEENVLVSNVKLGNMIANLLETGNDIIITKETISECKCWEVINNNSRLQEERYFDDEYLDEFKQELRKINLFLESLL